MTSIIPCQTAEESEKSEKSTKREAPGGDCPPPYPSWTPS